MDKSVFTAEVVSKYDERLLEDRLSVEGNVCGCLLKNLELYDECGITPEDFKTTHGRILFAIVKQLRENGYSTCDEITYSTAVADRIRNMVEEMFGGYRQINNVIQTVSLNNWEAFLDKFNKMNALMALSDKGFNIFNKIILDNGKEIIPFDYFEKLTCNEVLEFYEGTIASMQTNLKNEKLIEDGYIDFDDAWLKTLKNKEELGVSFADAGEDINGVKISTFPFMSSNTLGLKPGTLSAWGAASGSGKSIPNYTLIPTPNGYRTVGSIKPGDYLFGQNGKPTKVLMIHPQEEQKEIWKVTFRDGRVAECCKDHLWEYRYSSHGGYSYRTETIEDLYKRANGRFTDSNGGYLFSIKTSKAVEYPARKLSVDPYVMGALIGNAYFGGRIVEYSSGDDSVPNEISKCDGGIECVRRDSKYEQKYVLKSNGKAVRVDELLKDYPDLIKSRSYSKFIPGDYLVSSVEQRLALLQGLLDTDGTISEKGGRVSFCTTSPRLKDDFVELCRSLGYIATVRKDSRTKYKSGVCYSIGVLTPKQEKVKLFRCGKKLNRAIEYVKSDKKSMYNDHLAIVNIEPTKEKVDMTCFTVEAEDHLFLMNDYIVTHNTTYMVTMAMSLAEKGEKIVMVTNESKLSELKAIFLSWVIYRIVGYTKLSKRKILTGDFTEEDEKKIRIAQKYWKEHYAKKIKVVTLSDADAAFSCQIIKKAILREAASTFIVDTMKMTLSEDANDNSWVGLIKDVRSLTEIAMKYNVIGIITVQLAPSTLNRSWLDASCLANCKQIKETLSNLILFRKLYGPELDQDSPFYIHPFRNKKRPNEETGEEEWFEEPYEADRSKTWVIAFVDKTRRGIDSGMDGTAYLCRTDLDHASFYETARCKPTRKMFSVEDRRG